MACLEAAGFTVAYEWATAWRGFLLFADMASACTHAKFDSNLVHGEPGQWE